MNKCFYIALLQRGFCKDAKARLHHSCSSQAALSCLSSMNRDSNPNQNSSQALSPWHEWKGDHSSPNTTPLRSPAVKTPTG